MQYMYCDSVQDAHIVVKVNKKSFSLSLKLNMTSRSDAIQVLDLTIEYTIYSMIRQIQYFIEVLLLQTKAIINYYFTTVRYEFSK